MAALLRAGERPSLAAIARISKTIDPAEPRGISESAVLHNEEAYGLHRQHAQQERNMQRKPSPEHRTNILEDGPVHVSRDRDPARARQRYMRASKTELVQRLLTAEKGYADMENRWLRTADDVLVWIMLLDGYWLGSD
jgi:hypothetical protein